MLDKIIEGMKEKPSTQVLSAIAPIAQLLPAEVLAPPPADLPAKREAKANEVEIMVDAGMIKSIKKLSFNSVLLPYVTLCYSM